jgi:hypothetical protein
LIRIQIDSVVAGRPGPYGVRRAKEIRLRVSPPGRAAPGLEGLIQDYLDGAGRRARERPGWAVERREEERMASRIKLGRDRG